MSRPGGQAHHKRKAALSNPHVGMSKKRRTGSSSADEEDGGATGSGGSSCHQCKSRRTLNELTPCTTTHSTNGRKKKICRKKYCKHCLRKFYNESVSSPSTWKCPSCRGHCTCAACRRREERRKLKKKNRDDGVGKKKDKKGKKKKKKKKGKKDSRGRKKSMASSPLSSTAGAALAAAAAAAKGASPASHHHRMPRNMLTPMLSPPGGSPMLPPTLPSYGMSPQLPALSRRAFMEAATSTNPHTQSTCYGILYVISQLHNVKKHIGYILARSDITDGQKVETIAELLRRALDSNNCTVSASDVPVLAVAHS